MPKARILVIDDEESPRESLRFILKDRYDVTLTENGPSGLEAANGAEPFDLVLLDMKMPGMDGLEVLSKILQFNPAMKVVMVTAITEAKPAVQAMKLGAADYLNKPFDVDEIRLVVDRILKEKALEREVGRLRTELQAVSKFENIVGSSAPMQKVYALVQRVMDTDTTVLVLGETGTGKELVARALHYNSVRREGPFIPVHCAAIPSELLESELFGHEKGAFTGALQRRIGMFEAAGGGTLFLDEIGEMPHGTQSKLLRAIQEREIRRVGGQETISINVRLVCATNRDLEKQVARGAFREDLYYRINVVPITIPSLRERKDDIPPLVLHFAQRFGKDLNREVPQFTPSAMELLLSYPWPGNVRELEHAIERLLVTCDSNKITAEDLPFVISQADQATAQISSRLAATTPQMDLGEKLEFKESGLDLPKITEDLERRAIEEALRRTGGVITEAARSLHITRRMLRYKMDKLQIASSRDNEPNEPDEEPEELDKSTPATM
ncbi:MAG TPA: sigma-54 dependent transcriptional regulator [Verrucomicrobiae bacterium]|nr:sigma-54 dependent transcriptional regulator [Verrucomicrobiae bacterium]